MFHKQAEAVSLEGNKMENERKKKEKQSSSERSPLQELKRFQRSNTSIPSSSCSTSVSVDAPRGCLRFLLSANSNSSSSSSSSKRPHCQIKPKSFSKLRDKSISVTPKSAPNSTRFRSKAFKENDLPRVASQKSKKNPSLLSHWQSGKKSSLKSAQASQHSSNFRNFTKNLASGSEGFEAIRKDLKQMEQEKNGSGQPTEIFSFEVGDNLNKIENCTPVVKLPCWPALDSANSDDKLVEGHSNSASTKTPPIEASVSPEIQSGAPSFVVSAATPVCYGLGHILSGVTDKRKCRARGILTIGNETDEPLCGRTNIFLDNGNENSTEVIAKPRPSFVPSPTEASMRWLSSPHGESDEVQKCDSSEQCMTLLSSSIGLPFSPSNTGFRSDLVSDSDGINQSSNLDSTTSTGKTRIVLLSPRTSNFQSFSGLSPKTRDADLSLATPQPKSNSGIINRPLKEGSLGCRSITDLSVGEISQLSPCSFGSSNLVQNPKSDSSSGKVVDISEVVADDSKRNEFNFEIDSVVEAFDRARLSPRSHMFMGDPHLLSPKYPDSNPPSHSINVSDNYASWASDSTLQNMSISQMRISWREGLESRIFDTEEFDCCRCLSDEEKDVGQPDKLHMKSPMAFESINVEDQNAFENDDLNSPEYLEQEPMILGKGKQNLSPAGDNLCAESISTDGGGLVVSSGDSDWTLTYKNTLFEV